MTPTTITRPLTKWAALLSILTSLVVIVGATTYDSTVRRSAAPDPRVKSTPHVRSDGNAASQGLPMHLGVTSWRDSYSVESLREWTFAAANKCKVPAAMLFRQVRAESGFRWWVVSASGAKGLMQLKPYHAYWPLDLLDPETNLNLGACLMRRHYERLKGMGLGLSDAEVWELALHAYHDGEYRVRTSAVARRYAKRVLGEVPRG